MNKGCHYCEHFYVSIDSIDSAEFGIQQGYPNIQISCNKNQFGIGPWEENGIETKHVKSALRNGDNCKHFERDDY